MSQLGSTSPKESVPSTVAVCANCAAICESARLSERQRGLLLQAAASEQREAFNGVTPAASLLPADDPRLREDILRLILQYLHDEGFHAARQVLQDEAMVKLREDEELSVDHRRFRKAILEGAWAEVDKLASSQQGATILGKNVKSFMYAVYRQQFLELVDSGDMQKALALLNKRVKPLVSHPESSEEFKDMCYLLSCGSVRDVRMFSSWEGAVAGRENIAEQFINLARTEAMLANDEPVETVPKSRLLTLLGQAAAHQIESCKYRSRHTPRIHSLLTDYQSLVVPNAQRHEYSSHRGNVKCIAWVGEQGLRLASGSSDNSIRVRTLDGSHEVTLNDHDARIWDLASDRDGALLASASADGTVKLWDMTLHECRATLTSHPQSDVYSVRFHPGNDHVATGGNDKVVRLWDVQKEVEVKSFLGHQLAVSSVLFNPLGNLIISGSKDQTVCFFDTRSGLCVKTIASHLAEVSSLDISSSGAYLLSSTKDNGLRLWDLRMSKPVRRYRGHQNMSKNFVRASFAGENLVVSGSEDAYVHVWDREHAEVLQRLGGHTGTVYDAVWNARQAMLASCSDDRSVRCWWYDAQRPLYTLDEEFMEMERGRVRQMECVEA